jgi:hypothetical protein
MASRQVRKHLLPGRADSSTQDQIADLDNEDWTNVPEMTLVTEDDEYLIWDGRARIQEGQASNALLRVEPSLIGEA